MSQRPFPKDFYWGAAISSHQAEGDTHTQWDEWEQAKVGDRPKAARKMLGKLPFWPALRDEAECPETYIAGQAVDHYHRYREDFDILKSLNMNAFRFSIEWARIEPVEGEWDKAVIAYYRTYLQTLREQGIEPFVTLWHFTSPVWFERKGGFTRRANIQFYLRYVRKIMDELGDLFRYVMPINEPNTYVMTSFLAGFWPPQQHNPLTALRVYRNLARAHNEAYSIINAHVAPHEVGNVLALLELRTHSRSPLARLSLAINKKLSNYWFLDRTRGATDFIGLNFYMTIYIGASGLWHNPREPVSDVGWYMEPGGIAHLMKGIFQRYRLPIYVTENGLADHHDKYRQWWISETLEGLREALDAGVDLRGYMHWSLLDNFEWAFGWLAEFGLVHVDRKTMQRTVRPSARWFAEQIAIYRGIISHENP